MDWLDSQFVKGIEEELGGEATRGYPQEAEDEDEDDQYSDINYLQSQLRRSQAILHSLEQSQVPGETNLQLQNQIAYQRSQVTELEDRLRELSSSREQVLQLLKQVREAVDEANPDPHTSGYLHTQVQSVEMEYQRQDPNQAIISAAISATVLIAERLGGSVVDPSVVQQLSRYAPSAWGRRV
jgi:hypothetical protein